MTEPIREGASSLGPREKDLPENELPWWSWDGLLSTDRPYLYAMSSRAGIGKTFSAMKMMLENFRVENRPSIFLTSMDKDVNGLMRKTFSRAKKLFPELMSRIELSRGREWKMGSETVIRFGSVSVFRQFHGLDDNSTKFIFLDEFAPVDGRYPHVDHRDGMLGALSDIRKSVARETPDVRILCAANWHAFSNPYWARHRIYPKSIGINDFPEAGVAVDMVNESIYRHAMDPDDPASRAESHAGITMHSEPPIGMTGLIRPRTGRQTKYGVVLNGQNYQMLDSGMVVRGSASKMVAGTITDMTDKIPLIDVVVKKQLSEAIMSGKAYFEDESSLWEFCSWLVK